MNGDGSKSPLGMTPPEIVAELDKYIVGQAAAKRAVAIALRNRWRRFRVEPAMRDEVMPKNIILVGPTGVGKTEIARRLAKLAQAPFVKVEASKFTEVGYVGRDVDSMIRDLAEQGVQMVRDERRREVQQRADAQAEEKLLDLLLNPGTPAPAAAPVGMGSQPGEARSSPPPHEGRREKLRSVLRAGGLEERQIEIEVTESGAGPTMQIFGNQGVEEMGINLKEMLSNLPFAKKSKKRKLTVADARKLLAHEEAAKLVDDDAAIREAIERVQSSGIVFIDEIDKVASSGGGEGQRGPDVSRGGVQRDLLPIVEGSTVNTKYGLIKTDHILFIAAGAFHVAKVSDLLPELQGRFPIRVELEPLGEAELVRILTQPQNALTRQVSALLRTEGIAVEFDTSGVQEVARVAAMLNEQQQNIGARRLHAVVEKVLEETSFRAAELAAAGQVRLTVDAAFVRAKLASVLADEDLARYIL